MSFESHNKNNDQNSDDHPIMVSGAAAEKAARVLRESYYFRDTVTDEIEDVAYADGPIENLKAAISIVTDKARDKYSAVLDPKQVSTRESITSGAKNINTSQEKMIWSTLIPTRNEVVGYINFPKFYRGSSRLFKKHLRKLPRKRGNRKPMDATVIDLRNNPGGLVSEAEEMLSALCRESMYYALKHPDQQLDESEKHEITGVSVDNWRDTIILVNQISASASNIVAGVMQDSGRGLVVGQKTSAKTTRQSTVSLQSSPEVQLKYTDRKIIMPSGFDIDQNGGLEPNTTVDDITTGTLTYNDRFDAVMFKQPISIHNQK